MFVLIKG